MWKYIKKLLGWVNKPELKEEATGGILYVYPKTDLQPRRKPQPPSKVPAVLPIGFREWIGNCKEVDQLRRKLYA